jgi:peptide deformylase
MLRARKNRPILTFGHPGLIQAAEEIKKVDQDIRDLAAEMFDIMYAAPGVGLAAPQVNIHKRICVIGFEEGPQQIELTLINPRITSLFGEEENYDEGCLSFPGIHAHVMRPSGVVVEAIGLDGKPFSLRTEGFLARVLQHEIDHLNGVLFIERLAERERRQMANALERLREKSLKKYGLSQGKT